MEILCEKLIYYLGLACPFLRSDKTRFRSKFIVTNQSSRVEFLSIILWTKRYHLSKSVLVSLAEEHWNRSEAIECNRSQENKFLWSCEPTTFTSKKSRVHFGEKRIPFGVLFIHSGILFIEFNFKGPHFLYANAKNQNFSSVSAAGAVGGSA